MGIRYLFYLLVLSFLIFACTDEQVDEIPLCMGVVISDFTESLINSNARGATGKIDEYNFQNQRVCLLLNNFPVFDAGVIVMNSNCEIIGNVFSGFGNDEINGENFHDKAEFIRTIWEKEI